MKKFLCTLLCLIMVFAMMPMATGVAFADGPESYGIWVGGQEVTPTNTRGDGWEYVFASNTIILSSSFTDIGDDEYTVDEDHSGVYYFIYSMRDELTVEVSGDITINASNTDMMNNYNTVAIGGTGNIIIDGDGTLNISTFDCGVGRVDDNMDLVVGTETNINCNTIVGFDLGFGDMINYGTITATCYSNGIGLDNGTLTNYGTVISTVSETNSNGIRLTNGNLTNYGTITSTGNKEDSKGILIGSGNIANYGIVNSTGAEGGIVLQTGDLTNNADIIATGNWNGIYLVSGSLTNYGRVSSTAGFYGIMIEEGNFTNERVITASATYSGIYIAKGGLINKGDITAIGSAASGLAIAGGIISNYGNITATGNQFGIANNGNGDLTNYGIVTSTSGCYGICNYYSDLINYGTITSTGTSYGIYNETGTLTNCNYISAVGNNNGIFSVYIVNSKNIIAQGSIAAIDTRNISNENENLEILASEEIGNTPVSKEISELNASLTSYKYVKISPKESQPKPSYHGSSFDYELYMANLAKLEKEKHDNLVKEVKKALKNTEFKATSTKQTKLNGKKAVKIKWEVVGGEYDLSDFDGFDIYRSAKKNSGYTKTPFFTTTKWTYTNNKDLKVRKTYYYKVRAWKMVDGEKVYTGWSTKAWRTVQ